MRTFMALGILAMALGCGKPTNSKSKVPLCKVGCLCGSTCIDCSNMCHAGDDVSASKLSDAGTTVSGTGPDVRGPGEDDGVQPAKKGWLSKIPDCPGYAYTNPEGHPAGVVVDARKPFVYMENGCAPNDLCPGPPAELTSQYLKMWPDKCKPNHCCDPQSGGEWLGCEPACNSKADCPGGKECIDYCTFHKVDYDLYGDAQWCADGTPCFGADCSPFPGPCPNMPAADALSLPPGAKYDPAQRVIWLMNGDKTNAECAGIPAFAIPCELAPITWPDKCITGHCAYSPISRACATHADCDPGEACLPFVAPHVSTWK